MAVTKHKSGQWAVYYMKDGKKKWEYFGHGLEGEQRARARDEQIKRERGTLKPVLSLTVEALLVKYHTSHRVEATTKDSDWYRIDRVLVPALGHHETETLSKETLDKYVDARIADGKSPRTVDRELDVLKSACNWASDQDPPLIVRNPMARYRNALLKQPRQAKINPISKEELERLLRHAPAHLIRGMVIQWYGGLRPGGEVERIRWIDVSFEQREIRIESAHKGGPEVRYVPIHDELLPIIRQWKAQDLAALEEQKKTETDIETLPVVHYYGKPVHSLKTAWAATKKRAGIQRKLRLYDFRHAWFSNSLRGGADLKAISEVGGHSRPDTTLIFYQHVTREQHHQAVNTIEAVAVPEAPSRIVKKKTPKGVLPFTTTRVVGKPAKP